MHDQQWNMFSQTLLGFHLKYHAFPEIVQVSALGGL